MPLLTPTSDIIASILGALAVIVWRIQEGKTAVTLKKILIPPLGMATGFSMFIVPAFRLPWLWALLSFVLGATLLAWPLMATTRLQRDGEVIMLKRSSAFLAVIIVLAAVRILARGYFDRFVSIEQTVAVFFVLAFGMIFRWRAGMFFEYRALTAEVPAPAET